MELKPGEMKVVETRIGYSLFLLKEKSKPVLKVKAAVLTRAIEPSNQTFQDTYMKASAFAGQNKTPEAFDKAAVDKGLPKRAAQNVREMDSYVSGLPSAREMVRWSFAENTKVGEVSPVFDLSGKYAIAVLKGITKKGAQPLEAIKSRIEPSVRNMKKIDMAAEKLKQAMSGTNDIAGVAARLNAKIDTSMISMSGYSQSNVGREMEVVGKLFTMKKNELQGPLVGNFGAYCVYITDVMEAPAKDNFTMEKMQQEQSFGQRAIGGIYPALEKTSKISDNRLRFY